MNLLSLYHFFAGKASDKQKEAIKRWAESSPDIMRHYVVKRKYLMQVFCW